MKTSKKRIIVAIAVISVVILLIPGRPIIEFAYFCYVSKWKPAIDDFKSYEDSFVAMANYAEQYFDSGCGDDREMLMVSKDPDTGEITLYDYQLKYLTLDDDTRRCLNDIIEAFSDPDYPLDQIRRYEDKIYFHSEKGHYALIYSPNGKKPKYLTGPSDNKPVSVKKIKRNWYHVVRNPGL